MRLTQARPLNPEALIYDVHADMAVAQKRVAGPHEKDEGEKVPLELLGENKAGLEQVTHDHVHKHDHHQSEGHPGHAPTDMVIKIVNNFR